MLNQVKHILIDENIQQKLNDLQTHFAAEEGITYSEAAIFRRAVCALHKKYFKKDNENINK